MYIDQKIWMDIFSRKPEGKKRTVFIVQDRQLAELIVQKEMWAIDISTEEERDDFCDLIRDHFFVYISEYVFAPTVGYGVVREVSEFLKVRGLKVLTDTWKVFRGKSDQFILDPEFLEEELLYYIDSLDACVPKKTDIDRFHTFNSKGALNGVKDYEVVDYLTKQENFFVIGKTPYIYEKGLYQLDINQTKTKEKIQNLLHREVRTARRIKGIYDLLLDQECLQKKWDELNAHPKHWINFKNGMLDVKTGEMHPHDPSYYSINQIPWEYEPETRKNSYCNSEGFLKSALDPEDRKTLFQFVGLAMTTMTSFQNFLVLLGEGGNGKSVLISVVEHLIGRENISSASLQELTQRFTGARLFGKTLNSCADIPAEYISDDSNIKKMTGEDMITREHKGKDATEYIPYAKFLFSANRFPQVNDKSEGFIRRLRVIMMDKKPSSPDPFLKDKLKAEMDFWIMHAVEGLKELLEEGVLYESERSRIKRGEIETMNNSVMAFIQNCLVPQTDSIIQSASMYPEYQSFCLYQGLEPLGRNKFLSELKTKTSYHTVRDGREVYRNVAFALWKDEDRECMERIFHT